MQIPFVIPPFAVMMLIYRVLSNKGRAQVGRLFISILCICLLEVRFSMYPPSDAITRTLL